MATKYIKRHMEELFLEASDFFKAVLLTGPRQVGKTYMLMHLKQNNRTYVSLDDDVVCNIAKTDPALFFQMYKPPILIDEVQKAPQLFNQIKIICDQTDEKGLFWLTGSQKYKLLKNASETLTGRIGILNLYGFSTSEVLNNVQTITEIDYEHFSEKQLDSRIQNVNQIYERIFQGGYPQVISATPRMRKAYYDSYLDTYLMRDVMEDTGITDIAKFKLFIRACASMVGNLVNYANLSNQIGISQPTAKTWLGILQSLGIVFLLEPFSNNNLNSLIRTPKLYFWDSGFAAYLCGWQDSNTLSLGPSSGAFFENYVISEIQKSRIFNGSQSTFSYYRDKNGNEIDLILQENQTVTPIEIKRTASPEASMAKAFHLLKVNEPLELGTGVIICNQPKVLKLADNLISIPAGLV